MCLSRLIYTMRPCLIHTCHAAPMPCSDHAVLLKATAQHGRRETVCGIPAAFGFFRLPRGVPRRLLSEAYRIVAAVARATGGDGRIYEEPRNLDRQGKSAATHCHFNRHNLYTVCYKIQSGRSFRCGELGLNRLRQQHQ
jgi:hypothetical protein